ncbi:zinc finger protein 62 homolog [Sabethes cyaneus]|uniref:zinc finger protein 62 homolog n=1 Tax=Sabethes cyaneus TaxID=53552 RepID=UPI00237DB297|nr:zinc finger protein 62 homolog [Sabethes cyaneus]
MTSKSFDVLQKKYQFVLQNFQRLCRVCASTENLIDIFSNEKTADGDSVKRSNVFNAERNINRLFNENYFPYDPAEEFGLPDYICEKCMDTLVRWHRFRETYAITTNLLHKVREQLKSDNVFNKNASAEYTLASRVKIIEESGGEDIAIETECNYEIEFLQALPENAVVDNVTIIEKRDESEIQHELQEQEESDWDLDDRGSVFDTRSGILSNEKNDEVFPLTIKSEEILEQKVSLNRANDGSCKLLRHKRDFNQCPVCGVIVKSKLKHHLMRHSVPGGRPFKCSECDRAYSFKRSLNDHVRQVHENIRYPCDICEKEFVSRDVLRIHRKLHLDESYQCDICAQTFQQRVYLRKHMAMHEGKRFSCDDCGKNFRFKELLKQHLRIHTGEKPFLCTLCLKSFRTSSHLKQHHRTHAKVKLFKCTHCPAVEYACKKSLDRHNGLEHPTAKAVR